MPPFICRVLYQISGAAPQAPRIMVYYTAYEKAFRAIDPGRRRRGVCGACAAGRVRDECACGGGCRDQPAAGGVGGRHQRAAAEAVASSRDHRGVYVLRPQGGHRRLHRQGARGRRTLPDPRRQGLRLDRPHQPAPAHRRHWPRGDDQRGAARLRRKGRIGLCDKSKFMR